MGVYGLILCGGSGTRLWPLSSDEYPKQFLRLCGARTLIQETALRMLNVVPLERLHVMTGSRWVELSVAQLSEVLGGSVPDGFIIEEPCARGTGPAIILAVEELRRLGLSDDDVIIATPSDHVIKHVGIFTDALRTAVEAARAGYIATLGILPTRVETGFGYIRLGEFCTQNGWYEVREFVEKPDIERASAYVRSGKYLWNGGIFVFSVGSLYSELRKVNRVLYDLAVSGRFREEFTNISPISFDKALMELTGNAAVAPLKNSGWSDVGSWDALHEVLDHDDDGNAVSGDGGAVLINGSNNLICSDDRPIVLSGVSDLIVVNSPDAIFVTRRGLSQEVRNAAEIAKRKRFS